MTRSPWLWPAVILFSAVAVVIVVFGGVTSPLRPLVAFWFLLVCPGMAFIPLLRLTESFAEWTLAIALSLALDAIVAGTMLYAGMWSPNFGLTILISISMIGAVLQVLVAYGRMIAPAETTTRAEPSGVLSLGRLGIIAAGGLVVLALLIWAQSGQTDDEVRADLPETTLLAQSTTNWTRASAGPTATSTATPTQSPVPTVTPIPRLETPTAVLILTVTTSPTASRTPSAATASATSILTATPTPCIVSPPSNWEQYTVRPGDDLYTLATVRDAIAIVEVLGQVNCLDNPRMLSIDQVLWLPPLVPTATPTLTPTPP